jgi:hypothetical protein
MAISSDTMTPGIDMAIAFVTFLVGPKIAMTIRSIDEVSIRDQDDDEWAEHFGLE